MRVFEALLESCRTHSTTAAPDLAMQCLQHSQASLPQLGRSQAAQRLGDEPHSARAVTVTLPNRCAPIVGSIAVLDLVRNCEFPWNINHFNQRGLRRYDANIIVSPKKQIVQHGPCASAEWHVW